MINISFDDSQKMPDSCSITDSGLKKAFAKLEEKKKNHTLTVAESRRYQRLKKHGDAVQNKASIKGNKPSKAINLEILNTLPTKPTQEKIKQVVDRVSDGLNVIEACKQSDIAPKIFFRELDKQQNFELKAEFFRARCLLAEYYLARREQLEEDLKQGRVDCSTYSALSSDYKYLAGKLHPAAYGDKIKLDIETSQADSIPSQERLSELNKLLNTVDVDYSIADPTPKD